MASPKKPRKKDCGQKPSKDFAGCPFYGPQCKYKMDANACRLTFGMEEDEEICEVD